MSIILWRINQYLQLGGLFNPEMMEHDKVRDLLMDCRTEITRLRALSLPREPTPSHASLALCPEHAIRLPCPACLPAAPRCERCGGTGDIWVQTLLQYCACPACARREDGK